MEKEKSPLKWECLGEKEVFLHPPHPIGGTDLNLSILNFELGINEHYFTNRALYGRFPFDGS